MCRQGGNQDGREAPESPPGPPQSAPGGVREPRRGARAGRGRHRRPRAAPRKAPETAGAADTQSRSTGGRKKHPILRKMTFHEGFGGVTGTAPERRSSKTWPTVETGSEIPEKLSVWRTRMDGVLIRACRIWPTVETGSAFP